LSSHPNRARALAAAALLLASTAAAADILVVRSVGPSAKSYPPGKHLPEGARLTLQAADQLILLDGRGTRMLRGPGTFAAGAAPAQVASAAPVQTQRRARIGAVRGVEGGPLRPPSLWHIDIARSADVCVADAATLTLWRRDTSSALPLVVTRLSDGASRRVAFEPGASTAAWPASLRPTEGARYRLDGGAQPTALTLHALPARPAGLEDMASALIAKGCAAQLDLLIETVRLPDAAPPG
jgi:hypothetical protein